MSVLFPDLASMLLARGGRRRRDGGIPEDSYDYGVHWQENGRAFRLTWVGAQMRDRPDLAGELYLARLGYGASGTPVELLCVVPPVPCDRCAAGASCSSELDHDPRPDANVEAILTGWADICGLPDSVGWIRDRVWEALRAGWATDPKDSL